MVAPAPPSLADVARRVAAVNALAVLGFWVGVIGALAYAGPRVTRWWERASVDARMWVVGLACLVVVPILVAAAVGVQGYVG